MMNNVLVRAAIAWFNDGKRLTALIVSALAMLTPKIRDLGVPIPEGYEVPLAGFIASWVLVALSKADVKIPVTPK